MQATEFVTAYNVALKSTPHAENKVGSKLPFRYKVTLTFKGESYTTKFMKGQGHVRKGKAIPPSADEVLECLAMDCRAFIDNPTYEDFASEFGYDPDSISGKKVWKLCRKSYLRLRKLFGDSFAAFLKIGVD